MNYRIEIAMRESMTRFHVSCMLLGAALGGCDVVETSTAQQAGENLQGENLQGENLQGENLQGMTMQGIRLHGAMLNGVALHNVRIDRGELVAERGPATLRGTSLEGAHFLADVRSAQTTPPNAAVVEYRIAAIQRELDEYDRPGPGHTFLYTLEQRIGNSSSWQPACQADDDGRQVAIPVAAIWDDHGDRMASNTQFTFGCTSGVIAKCYRWGYRPWLTGYGDMVAMHWTCTRLARADYCGIGKTHTHDGTKVNVWDTLPPPGPIQRHDNLPLPLPLPIPLPPPGYFFEAGWNTGGAVCLSRARWLLNDGPDIAALCPQRLVPPGVGETVCNSIAEALGYDADAKMFNESSLNIKL